MSVRSKRSFIVLFILLCLHSNVFAEQMKLQRLPEFTEKAEQSWLNSKPLSIKELQGKVLLIDVWTFACWNCYRSFPWLNTLERDLQDKPFQIIGIHSPEFDYEKEPESVRKKIKEFKLKHPVMLDNSFRYWRALKNNAWPSFYLVDKSGVIRGKFVGETHSGSGRDKEIRSLIQKLLAGAESEKT